VGPEREIGKNFVSDLKNLGWVPVCKLCTAFGVEQLYQTTWQNLLWNGWRIQQLSIYHPTCCLSEGWRGANWIMQSDPRYCQIQTCCIPIPSTELHCTYLCFLLL